MRRERLVGLVLLAVLVVLIAGCPPKPGRVPTHLPEPFVPRPPIRDLIALKRLYLRTVLFVVAPSGCADWEYMTARTALEKASVKVEVASTEKGMATGVRGMWALVDASLDEVSAAGYEGIVFIGGPGMVDYLTDESFLRLAKTFANADKVTAAIGVAPAILANAGVLEGVKATVAESHEGTLRAKGAKLQAEDVVTDGKVITATGADAAEQFGEAIVAALAGEELACAT